VNRSKRLTIFEGPDGAGKTTAAKRLAAETGARYVHLDAFKEVHHIAPLYVEAMLPAVLGHRDVVMDRCWYSELIYGSVFRSGTSRLVSAQVCQLERLAMRCQTTLVWCLPAVETTIKNFNARRNLELLDTDEQLRKVYELYDLDRCTLRRIYYDYETMTFEVLKDSVQSAGYQAHSLEANSAGNLDGRVLLVGDSFGPHKEGDPLYQWPFGSLSPLGCSRWLTEQLEQCNIEEVDLCWVNADEDEDAILELGDGKDVIALGIQAGDVCQNLFDFAREAPHPQYWKRFKANEPYPLMKLLTELLP